MVLKARPLRESHRAEFTLKWFLAGMYPRMLLKAHFLIERLPTDSTRERAFLSVRKVVSFQMGRAVGSVKTILALVAQASVISFRRAH